MNKIDINAEGILMPLWSVSLCKYAKMVLKEIKQNNWQLSILLCDDKTIKNLNNKFRKKNEPTDILSFNQGETIFDGKKSFYLPGDIVISLDSLKKNAQYFEITEDEELRRLVIHGILHLDHMEHGSSVCTGPKCVKIKQNEPMLILQEETLNKLKDEHIIPKKSGGKK